MAEMGLAYQRRDVRIPFTDDVRFSTDEFSWHRGRARNISRSGIFVETDRMAKVGSRIFLNFSLATNFQNVKAMGEIVRLDHDKGNALGRGMCGMGIKFSLLPSEELMIKGVIRDVVNGYDVPKGSSSVPKFAKRTPYVVEDQGSFRHILKWWVKEIVSKSIAINGLIVELVLLLIVLMVVVKAFFTKQGP
jgi:Tfp pilus assembly protein PilZ